METKITIVNQGKKKLFLFGEQEFFESIDIEDFVPHGAEDLILTFCIIRGEIIIDKGSFVTNYLGHRYFNSENIFASAWGDVAGDTVNCSLCFQPRMFEVGDTIVFKHNTSFHELLNCNNMKVFDEYTYNVLHSNAYHLRRSMLLRRRKGTM